MGGTRVVLGGMVELLVLCGVRKVVDRLRLSSKTKWLRGAENGFGAQGRLGVPDSKKKHKKNSGHNLPPASRWRLGGVTIHGDERTHLIGQEAQVASLSVSVAKCLPTAAPPTDITHEQRRLRLRRGLVHERAIRQPRREHRVTKAHEWPTKAARGLLNLSILR